MLQKQATTQMLIISELFKGKTNIKPQKQTLILI